MASCIFQNLSQWSLCIPESRCAEGVVFYEIHVRVGGAQWTVSRRYNEFAALNAVLVKEQGISKDLLPPKKFVGNLKPEFVEQRRSQLETYLNDVFQLLVKTMPLELAAFLRLDECDVMFLIRRIPEILAAATSETPILSVLQVHALSARLKLPCPPVEMTGYQHDFCSILEACARIRFLQIEGCGDVNLCLGSPPLIDFIPFKSLRGLILNNVPPNIVNNADALRSVLCGLSWVNSGLSSIEEALLCDSVHKQLSGQGDHKIWQLKKADFSCNFLKTIGDAVTILPNLIGLELNGNQIQCLQGLNALTKLEKLSLKNNGISNFLELNLNSNLVHLTWICLAENKLKTLKGLDEFKMLRCVDVSNNSIADWCEISLVCSLPLLIKLVAFGNPVSSDCDYRVKVLEHFDDRVTFVSLDGETPTQKELDRVAVLQALRIVKEGRSPM